jgi:hypothetical protein
MRLNRDPHVTIGVTPNDQALPAWCAGRNHDERDAAGVRADVRDGARSSIKRLRFVTHCRDHDLSKNAANGTPCPMGRSRAGLGAGYVWHNFFAQKFESTPSSGFLESIQKRTAE